MIAPNINSTRKRFLESIKKNRSATISRILKQILEATCISVLKPNLKVQLPATQPTVSMSSPDLGFVLLLSKKKTISPDQVFVEAFQLMVTKRNEENVKGQSCRHGLTRKIQTVYIYIYSTHAHRHTATIIQVLKSIT